MHADDARAAQGAARAREAASASMTLRSRTRHPDTYGQLRPNGELGLLSPVKTPRLDLEEIRRGRDRRLQSCLWAAWLAAAVFANLVSYVAELSAWVRGAILVAVIIAGVYLSVRTLRWWLSA